MRIQVKNNGSLRVELAPGETLELVDAEGQPFGLGERRALSLCRCGASESVPFCDGSHNRCGFQSTVAARDLDA